MRARWSKSGFLAVPLALALLLSWSSSASAAAPSIEAEYVTDVSYNRVVFQGQVNPNASPTSYRFEYGPTTTYGSSVPVPDASVGSSSELIAVRQQAGQLQPGVTYHYRLVATSAEGAVEGPDKTFTTYETEPPEKADSCPNAAYRTGASANLLDCRAYEMVSPVDKNGADVDSQEYKEFTSSVSGDRVEFPVRTGFGETKGSGLGGYTQFMASRGADGWTTKGIIPTPALNDTLQLFYGSTYVLDLSEDFSRAALTGYDLPYVAGAPPETQSLYIEDTVDSQLLEPITRFEGNSESFIPFFFAPSYGGTSGDMGVVSFQINQNLVPQAKGSSRKVYVLDHGVVRLVSILPNGELPVEASLVRESEGLFGGLVSQYDGAIAHRDTVSQDGSRVFFYATPERGERQLYVRKNGTSSVLVSESEASTPESAQKVAFQAATPDGRNVVFSTSTRLLDSDPGGEGIALYLYKDSENPESESNLTYIGRFSGDEEGIANEDRVVKGISADASHIYFDSAYTSTLPFKTVSEGLFLWDKGQIRQVAPEPGARGNVAFNDDEEARVSKDGRRIVFMNSRTLTKNEITGLGSLSTILYMYDEDSNTLKCISCSPSGAAVTSGAEATVRATERTNPSFFLAAQPRFFSVDGRFAFFNTTEALLPQDTNGVADAYEYDTETGKLSLLSSGTGETGTWFVDASPDGSNVFLVTRQKLSPQDPDKLVDLYDARIDGGLAEPPAPASPCDGDACQGTPSAAPSFSTASGFNGMGNPARSRPEAEHKAKPLTRAQRLKRALVLCKRKKHKAKRVACERAARRDSGKTSAKRVVGR